LQYSRFSDEETGVEGRGWYEELFIDQLKKEV
jgi:hypothetical protein